MGQVSLDYKSIQNIQNREQSSSGREHRSSCRQSAGEDNTAQEGLSYPCPLPAPPCAFPWGNWLQSKCSGSSGKQKVPFPTFSAFPPSMPGGQSLGWGSHIIPSGREGGQGPLKGPSGCSSADHPLDGYASGLLPQKHAGAQMDPSGAGPHWLCWSQDSSPDCHCLVLLSQNPSMAGSSYPTPAQAGPSRSS